MRAEIQLSFLLSNDNVYRGRFCVADTEPSPVHVFNNSISPGFVS